MERRSAPVARTTTTPPVTHPFSQLLLSEAIRIRHRVMLAKFDAKTIEALTRLGFTDNVGVAGCSSGEITITITGLADISADAFQLLLKLPNGRLLIAFTERRLLEQGDGPRSTDIGERDERR